MLNQCRALDKSRLTEKIGEVDVDAMRAAENALRVVFALN